MFGGPFTTMGSGRFMDSLRSKRIQLYAASFLVDAVGHAFPVLVEFHAQETFGAAPRDLGFLGAVWMIVYSLICFTTGGWSDRWGSVRLMRGSLVFLGLGLLPAVLLASRFQHLLLAMGALGIALGFFWPPLQRQLSLFSPGRALWPALGNFNLAWAAGSVLGTVAGGPRLLELLGFRGTLGIAIGLVLLALAATLRLRGAPPPAAPRGPLEEVPDDRARLFLRLGWAANFCGCFAMGGIHMVFAHVAQKLSLTSSESTAILTAKEVGRFVAFFVLTRWPGWHYSLRWLLVLQILGGGAAVAAGWVENVSLLCCLLAVLGLFSGLAYYSSLFYSLSLRSEEGRKSGLHEGILALGVIAGPVALGEAGEAVPGWAGLPLVVAGGTLWAGVLVELWLAGSAGRGRKAFRNDLHGVS